MADLTERLDSIESRLSQIKDYLDLDVKRVRLAELRARSAEPDFWNDPQAARNTSRDIAALSDDVEGFDRILQRTSDARVLMELAAEEGDAGSLSEAEAEIAAVEGELESLEVLALLAGEFDTNPAIVEIHPGEGGTDSQDWAEILLRMYTRWAERRGFKYDLLEATAGDEAGIKSATLTVEGRHAYGLLSAERGVHRLVRISPFDAAKRRHTSFASVDVTPEVTDDVEIEIGDDDLRIDTYRSSGAGGQHVNVTDSAVRITHLPTGIVVSCQNERSQMQNKAVAMRVLKSRLLQRAREERMAELQALKGEQRDIGFGSQIRSYVMHPYQMVKDHRTSYETGNVQGVLDGDLDAFIEAQLKKRASEEE
ncbi:MAG: peptide chain release factor 2 [Actinobacteria bacterium]|nr:peptide chain release factor 2 [Actinomycetota bacterium]